MFSSEGAKLVSYTGVWQVGWGLERLGGGGDDCELMEGKDEVVPT